VGRHRPDPRGHARILIAVAAVVLALALLIVGGIALFGALTNQSAAPGPSPTVVSKVPQSGGAATTEPAGAHALLVRVTGQSASVYVSTPGNTQTLFKGTLNRGEVRYFDLPEMVVVVDPAENVEVQLHGKTVSKGKTGKQSWTVGPS
jgi:hypothetical protein